MRRHQSKFVAMVIAASLLFARLAGAQVPNPESVVAARQLYERAVTLMEAQDYERACPKLAEAVRLVPDAAGTTMALASCYERQDKLASAWMYYVVSADLARRAGQTTFATEAQTKADGLEGKLAKLSVNVPLAVRAIPKVTITCAGKPLPETSWGEPLPVDKGSIEITVQTPGYEPWRQTVVIPNDGDVVKVNAEAPSVAIKPPVTTSDKPAFVLWTPGLVIAGVGVVGIVAGSLSGAAALSNKAIVDANCVTFGAGRYCNPAGILAIERTDQFALLSTVNLAVGFGALTTGIVLLAVMGKPPEKAPAKRAFQLDVIGPWGTGLGVRGIF